MSPHQGHARQAHHGGSERGKMRQPGHGRHQQYQDYHGRHLDRGATGTVVGRHIGRRPLADQGRANRQNQHRQHQRVDDRLQRCRLDDHVSRREHETAGV